MRRTRFTLTLTILLLVGALASTVLGAGGPVGRPDPREGSGARSAPGEAWHHLALGRLAAAEGKTERAVGNYREAVSLDPTLIGAWIGLASQGFPGDLHLVLEGLSGAIAAADGSWEVQRRLAAALLPPLWLATVLAATALLAGIGLRHLPRRRHLLLEAFRPHLGRWPAGSVATLLCLVPLGVQWGLAAAAACYAGLVRASLTRRESRLGLLALLWFFFAPGAWSITSPWFAPIDPRGLPHLIERTQNEIPTPELAGTVAAASDSLSPPAYAFVEGMLHRRSQRFPEATEAFRRALDAGGPIAAHATVNLGNLHLWSGDTPIAARHYQLVLDEPQARLEARYNLAIALSRLHRFEEADDRLAEAAQLDFGRVRSAVRAGGSANADDVMDGLLRPSELWRLDRRSVRRSEPIPPLLSWFLPGDRLGAAPFAILGGLLAGLVIGTLLQRRLRVHECQHCGRSVCRRCVVRTAGHAYCAACAATIGTLPTAAFNRALLKQLLSEERFRDRRTYERLTDLLPGIGPTLRGRPVWGLCLTWILAFGFLLATRAAWAFPDSPATGGLESLIRLSGAVLTLSAWAISILVARRARPRRGVRRYFERDVYRQAA